MTEKRPTYEVRPSRAVAGNIIEFSSGSRLILGRTHAQPATTFNDQGQPTMVGVDTVALDIEVTANHIRRGTRRKCYACPVALAIAEGFDGRGDLRVAVSGNAHFEYLAHIEAELDVFRFRLPNIAFSFIDKFDVGDEVTPVPFSLNPEELVHTVVSANIFKEASH